MLPLTTDDITPKVTAAAQVVYVFRRIDSAVVGLIISQYLLKIIDSFQNKFEVALGTVVGLAVYIIIHVAIINNIDSFPTLTGNKKWQDTLLDFLDFLFQTSIFFLVQFFLEILHRSYTSSNMSVTEQLLAIYTLIIGAIATIQSFSTVI
jgi:hypothetical protein